MSSTIINESLRATYSCYCNQTSSQVLSQQFHPLSQSFHPLSQSFHPLSQSSPIDMDNASYQLSQIANEYLSYINSQQSSAPQISLNIQNVSQISQINQSHQNISQGNNNHPQLDIILNSNQTAPKKDIQIKLKQIECFNARKKRQD
eukprot:53715_1